MTDHEQVDKDIADLLTTIWKNKIHTWMSCQDIDGKVWLCFDTKKDFIKFLNKLDFCDISIGKLYFHRKRRDSDSYVSFRFPTEYKEIINKRLKSNCSVP